MIVRTSRIFFVSKKHTKNTIWTLFSRVRFLVRCLPNKEGPGAQGPGAHMGPGPYGPWPIWARAHMGQGPYGPRAPGPRALPCWANTSPKNAPWKKESKLCFLCVFWKQKRCATSVRSFWRRYRAEISAMCQKTKVSVFEKIHNFVRYLSICEFATRRRL